MARSSYPLQWPDGWKRETYRTYPKFQGQFARDRDSVYRQLKRFGCSQIVITSDLPTRNDGVPYANATCSDPGIAVWWVKKGREHVIACDRWKTVGLNMRAIDMTIDALRGIDRWGTSQVVEKAFAGFAALPGAGETSEGIPMPPAKPAWHEVLGVTDLYKSGMLPDGDLLAIVKQRHREKIKLAHPDVGGDPAIAAELNAALAEAESELAP